MRNSFLFLLIFILLYPQSVPCDTLTLSIAGVPEKSRAYRMGLAIAENIGERIGVSFKFWNLPGKRAEFYLKTGKIDGDIARIIEFKDRFPDLIPIKEPFASLPYYVYSKDSGVKVNGWASLKPHKVVYITGTAYIKTNLEPFHKKLYHVSNITSAIKFLNAGRADLFISPRLALEELIKSGELKRLGIKSVGPPIAFLNLYTFFNSRHSEIAVKYAEALRKMKLDGSYMKIIKETK